MSKEKLTAKSEKRRRRVTFNSLSARTIASLEIILEFSAIFFYIWYVERFAAEWIRAGFFWFICVGFPLFCIWKEQKYFPEVSLDWIEFRRGLRDIFWFTLSSTIILFATALITEGLSYDGHIFTRFPEYCFWAFLQQIGLQTFLTRRLQNIFSNHWITSTVCASLFALIHWPNPALVILSWFGGFFWSNIFQRTPNLYALSLSHGWLAVFSLYSIPPEWIGGLRIGPGYFS